MKSSAYVIIILIFSVCCSLGKKPPEQNVPVLSVGDSIVGVITLKSSFDDKDTIKVLNSDGSVWHRFSFRYDDSDGLYDFQNESFKPLVFNPDAYSLVLTVVSKNGDQFEVLANEETRLKKYLTINEKSPLLFKTCTEFLTTSFAVSFDERTNPMLRTIGGEKLQLKKSDNYLIKPLQVKNDWLKVQHEDLTTKVKTEGWVKWRDKKKIIIQVHTD